MPTSDPGTSVSIDAPVRIARSRGFSLLEILVVVAIIGIFVGVTVLSTDLASFERKMEQEANRLGTLIGFAVDEALLQPQDFGIFVCEDSYHFFVYNYDIDAWVPYDVRPFGPRRLDADMLLELSIDDRDVLLEREAEVFLPRMRDQWTEDDIEDLPNPQIVILSSGEITPFRLEFLRESELLEPGVELNVAFNGRSEVIRSAF